MENNSKKINISKIKEQIKETVLSDTEKLIQLRNEIIIRLPKEYRDLIEESFKLKRVPKEYLLVSILYAVGVASGKKFYTNVANYKNYANAFFVIIGSRGDNKSEALKIATKSIKCKDNNYYEDFKHASIDKSDKNKEQPVRKRYLLQDATPESCVLEHYNNPNSIGLYFDELYGYIAKMNNSNSEDGNKARVFLCSSYTNDPVDVSRKTTESFRIPVPCPSLLGGIQNEFIPDLFSKDNMSIGFVDRLLFIQKLESNTIYYRNKVDNDILKGYEKCIDNILDEPVSNQKQIKYSASAVEELHSYIEKLIHLKEKSESPKHQYISKLQISIHKLAIILHLIKNSKDSSFNKELDLDTIKLAIDLNEFFKMNFEILLKQKGENFPDSINVLKLGLKNKAPQDHIASVVGKTPSWVTKNKDKL